MGWLLKSFKEAEPLIEEGDVLLFRGKGWISKLLRISGEGLHTHVGIASWHNGHSSHRGILECVEFREWKGGRAVNLKYQVETNNCTIDVYRPIPYFSTVYYDDANKRVSSYRKEFDGKLVTNTMRKMTGLPYGWTRIWWIAKHKMIGLRLFVDYNSLVDDQLEDLIYPVCSTAVAYSFSKHGFDLVKNRSDQWTEPAHIATSARLNYLFTLCDNNE